MSQYQNAQAPAQGESQAAAQPPAKSNPLSDRTFRLTRRDPQTQSISSLRMSVEKNCVRMAADVSRDASGQWVSMLFPKTEWGMLKEDILRAAKESNLPWSTAYRRNGESEIKVGISQEGIVYLAVSNTQGGEVKFDFISEGYIEIVDSAGNPVPPSELSRRRARNWVKEISGVVDIIFEREYADSAPAQRRQGGQGGQGGGNYPKKQWNNGGGYQNRGQGGGGFQKKQWGGGGGYQRNQGGGGYQQRQGGYQQNQGGGYQQQQQAPAPVDTNINFDDYNLNQ